MVCLRPRVQEEPELNQTLPQSLYTLHRVPEELTSDAECGLPPLSSIAVFPGERVSGERG